MRERTWDTVGRVILIAIAAFVGSLWWKGSATVGAIVGGVGMAFVLLFAFPRGK